MMMNKKKPFSLHLDVDSFMPATAEEKEVISRMRPSSTFFRDGVKRLLKNKVATISLILIVLITLSSIIIPMFWPYSYDQMLGQTKGRPMDNTKFGQIHGRIGFKTGSPFFRMLERCTLPSLATDISCLGKVHPAENMRELTGNLRECRNFQQEKGRETSN